MYKNILRLCAASLLALNTSAMAGVAFDVTGPTANDVDPHFSTPKVVNFTVLDTGTITSLGVRLTLTDFWDNIFVSLGHLGTTVTLMDFGTDDAGPDAVLDATFQDGGGMLDPGTCGTPCTGVFAPLQALSAFNGLELAGEWTFTFYDNADVDEPVHGDGSTLDASSLFGTVAGGVPSPAPLALMVLGLAGIASGLRQRR